MKIRMLALCLSALVVGGCGTTRHTITQDKDGYREEVDIKQVGWPQPADRSSAAVGSRATGNVVVQGSRHRREGRVVAVKGHGLPLLGQPKHRDEGVYFQEAQPQQVIQTAPCGEGACSLCPSAPCQ